MFLYLDSFVAGGISLLGFTILTNPRKVNVLGNRLLAIFLLLVAVLVFDKGLFDSHFYETNLDLLGFTDIFLYFTSPTLYLSVVYFISLDKTFNKKDLKHYVLPILLLPVFVYAVLQSHTTKLNTLKYSNYAYHLIYFSLLIQTAFYWVLAYLKLEKHRKNIQIFAASTEDIDLSWLKNFLWGIAGMIAISCAEFYFNNSSVFEYASIGYLIATYILSYFALRQNEISEKHSHFNMLGIAYASGFSSKTTFNTTFKKLTNQSPSEFKTAHLHNHSLSITPSFFSKKT